MNELLYNKLITPEDYNCVHKRCYIHCYKRCIKQLVQIQWLTVNYLHLKILPTLLLFSSIDYFRLYLFYSRKYLLKGTSFDRKSGSL